MLQQDRQNTLLKGLEAWITNVKRHLAGVEVETFPPTPIHATLMRSFAPRTRPTKGKLMEARVVVTVERRMN
jgi:hypothetical protein